MGVLEIIVIIFFVIGVTSAIATVFMDATDKGGKWLRITAIITVVCGIGMIVTAIIGAILG